MNEYGQMAHPDPKIALRLSVFESVNPSALVGVPTAVATVESSTVNPAGATGRSGHVLTTGR